MENRKKVEFQLDKFGTLKLNHFKSGSEWFGDVENISKSNKVELIIEVEDDNIPSTEQIDFIRKFSGSIQSVEQTIFNFMHSSFKGTKWQLEKEELKQMYSLMAVVFKRNGDDVWITLEPCIDLPSIFNFLPRFTWRSNKIVWSNLK